MGCNFIQDEQGAITVDWVVLSAGIVGIGIAVTTLISGGIEALSGETAGAMTGFGDGQSFADPVSTLLSNDFSGGLGGFIGGTVPTSWASAKCCNWARAR
jgi:hypothetical protein